MVKNVMFNKPLLGFELKTIELIWLIVTLTEV